MLRVWLLVIRRLGAMRASLPSLLADAHRRLSKVYGALASHRKFFAGTWRTSRLERKALLHSQEALRYAGLEALDRGFGEDEPEGTPVRQPRGSGPHTLSGTVAADVEEYSGVSAIAAPIRGKRAL
jgi:hypothetical protein